jgi:hypothetical protein
MADSFRELEFAAAWPPWAGGAWVRKIITRPKAQRLNDQF